MSTSKKQAGGIFSGWFADGPWRSKTVLTALVVCVVGLGFWYSSAGKNSPSESDPAATNATEPSPSGQAGDTPDAAPSKWSKPIPGYVKMSASYVVGYCVGWLFRRLLKLILLVSALAVALLAYGKFAGLDLEKAQEQVERGGKWAKHEMKSAKDYFKQMLPSATAGGVGIFLGFLRRNRAQNPRHEAVSPKG